MKRPACIGVTCVGGVLIYDLIMALRDAEDLACRIVGFDADPHAHGRLLCDAFATAPRADHDPDGWLNAMLDHAATHELDALLMMSDREPALAAVRADDFSAIGVELSSAPASVVATLTDKLLLLESLREGGLDVGAFRAVNTLDSAIEAAMALGYPDTRVVLKPRRESGSRGVLVFDHSAPVFENFLESRLCGRGRIEAALAAARSAEIDLADFVAVPYWKGPVFDVECLADHGRVLECVARRRQLVNEFSPTSTGHIVDMNPAVVEYARQMCRILNAHRATDFDIVLREDGKPAPFDAGARFSGSVGGGRYAGVNIVAQLVRSMVGQPLRKYEIRDGTPLRPFRTLAPIPVANQDQLL